MGACAVATDGGPDLGTVVSVVLWRPGDDDFAMCVYGSAAVSSACEAVLDVESSSHIAICVGRADSGSAVDVTMDVAGCGVVATNSSSGAKALSVVAWCLGEVLGCLADRWEDPDALDYFAAWVSVVV